MKKILSPSTGKYVAIDGERGRAVLNQARSVLDLPPSAVERIHQCLTPRNQASFQATCRLADKTLGPLTKKYWDTMNATAGVIVEHMRDIHRLMFGSGSQIGELYRAFRINTERESIARRRKILEALKGKRAIKIIPQEDDQAPESVSFAIIGPGSLIIEVHYNWLHSTTTITVHHRLTKKPFVFEENSGIFKFTGRASDFQDNYDAIAFFSGIYHHAKRHNLISQTPALILLGIRGPYNLGNVTLSTLANTAAKLNTLLKYYDRYGAFVPVKISENKEETAPNSSYWDAIDKKAEKLSGILQSLHEFLYHVVYNVEYENYDDPHSNWEVTPRSNRIHRTNYIIGENRNLEYNVIRKLRRQGIPDEYVDSLFTDHITPSSRFSDVKGYVYAGYELEIRYHFKRGKGKTMEVYEDRGNRGGRTRLFTLERESDERSDGVLYGVKNIKLEPDVIALVSTLIPKVNNDPNKYNWYDLQSIYISKVPYWRLLGIEYDEGTSQLRIPHSNSTNKGFVKKLLEKYDRHGSFSKINASWHDNRTPDGSGNREALDPRRWNTRAAEN